MVDGMLTQEEIDALLSGAAFTSAPAAKSSGPTPTISTGTAERGVSSSPLNQSELKTLGERLNQGFGAASQSGETLIGRPISFVPISLNMEDDNEIKSLLPPEPAHFEFNVSGDAAGKCVLVLSTPDAASIADILMGGQGQAAASLDDLYQSAAKEAVSNMINSLISSLGTSASKNISLGQVEISVKPDVPMPDKGKRVAALYSFSIQGLREGTALLVMENSLARSLASGAAPTITFKEPAPGPKQESVSVKQVQFPQLTPAINETQSKNIEILLDVPMQVTVELGRAQMMIRDILELGTGSIIELDKLAGEPVDLLVNSRLIARGEVVVIDENFGVRVTDIISPMERIKNMQG